jgi:hypothetical protein
MVVLQNIDLQQSLSLLSLFLLYQQNPMWHCMINMRPLNYIYIYTCSNPASTNMRPLTKHEAAETSCVPNGIKNAFLSWKKGKIKLCIDFSRTDCHFGHVPDTHFSMGAASCRRCCHLHRENANSDGYRGTDPRTGSGWSVWTHTYNAVYSTNFRTT